MRNLRIILEPDGRNFIGAEISRSKNDLELNFRVQCTPTDLQTEVIYDNKLHDDKVHHGEMIRNMIRAGEIKEESLSEKNRQYLELYLRSSEE